MAIALPNAKRTYVLIASVAQMNLSAAIEIIAKAWGSQ
jgi:hypothetical protein